MNRRSVSLAIFLALVPHSAKAIELSSVPSQKDKSATVAGPGMLSVLAKAQTASAANSPAQSSRASFKPAATGVRNAPPHLVPSTSTNAEVSPYFQVSPDPRDRVQLSVRNGIVTIEGSVGSQALAQTLLKRYAATAGVHELRNHLTVRPDPDADLAAKLRDDFSRDPDTHVGAIAVTVYHGIVFLSGTVSSGEERDRAEELARKIPGVTRVNNGLQAPPASRYPVRLTSGQRRSNR